jgi:hypothetical protein
MCNGIVIAGSATSWAWDSCIFNVQRHCYRWQRNFMGMGQLGVTSPKIR